MTQCGTNIREALWLRKTLLFDIEVPDGAKREPEMAG